MNEQSTVRVLLVEDDRGDVRIFRRHAADSQLYRIAVDHVTTCKDAVHRLSERAYDLVFLDLRLAGSRSGLDALRGLRSAAPEVPVVVLTGTGSEHLAVETMKHGAADYISKDNFNCAVLERSTRYALQQERSAAERRRAEEALRESEARFRALFESIPEGVIVHDNDGNILYANDVTAKRLEWPAEQLTGRNLREIVTPENRAPIPDHARQVRTSGSCTFETTYVSRSGRLIEAEVNGHPIEFGGQNAVLSVTRDITERKETERQRQRLADQMLHVQKLESLGVMAGGIAHDFNNLLVGVLGNAGLAMMELPPESPVRETVQQIQTAARRAAELCRQMLAYSGRGKLVIQPLDLSKLVQEMAHLLEAAISRRASVHYDFAEDLPRVQGDASQLTQVIMNLVTNASEAIGESSGTITLRTGAMEVDRKYLSTTYLGEELPEGDYVYLEVSDTGCGMDRQMQDKIFDPFFTTKFVGRGLGLAAVMGIVRSHHGAAKVYSEPGRGTTFKVLLPRDGRQTEQVETAGGTCTGWRGTGTLLVVDDEESARAVSKAALQRCGFEVLTAADGQEGVRVFREHADEIVAVILDLTMPHMSGEQAFTALRRVRKDVPIILASGYAQEEVICRFAGKGVAGFVRKPYEPQALLAKVREALGED
ncbi:MAG: response regulator [Candidatus Brocadiae bacterium]|nr:response regulator [Candidatus Brocadiia bacterium]